MKTLKEKNEMLGNALLSIDNIVVRFFRDAAGVSEEEKYDRGKTAFNEIAKEIAHVMRLDLFGDEPPKKSWVASDVGRTLKMPVISMPGKAAIKYQVEDPELPRLAAHIETIKSDLNGKVSCDCKLFAGNELLAVMQVYRGKSFALAMTRHALKGAMSKLGKRRRMAANRRAREAAASNAANV
jgi:hypothetical protein